MTNIELCLRLGVALLCGVVIGAERQWHQKMAGLRTNVLVALGSAGFVGYSMIVAGAADPTRMAAQVISGIGFLGAGVIMRDGLSVHGLNTAATLWCSAAVGTFAGGGYLVPSIIASLFIVGANLALRPLGNLIDRNVHSTAEIEVCYSVELSTCDAEGARLRAQLIHRFAESGLRLQSLKTIAAAQPGDIEITASVIAHRRQDALLEGIVGALVAEPAVTAAAWHNAGNRGVD